MFRIDCFTPEPPEQVRRPFKNIDPSSLSFNAPPNILHCSCIETLMPVLLWILTSPLMGFAWYTPADNTDEWLENTDHNFSSYLPSHPILKVVCVVGISVELETHRKFTQFSVLMCGLCAQRRPPSVTSAVKAGKLQLWIQSCYLPFAETCNWILIFHKADKCLPCRSNSMPDGHL